MPDVYKEALAKEALTAPLVAPYVRPMTEVVFD